MRVAVITEHILSELHKLDIDEPDCLVPMQSGMTQVVIAGETYEVASSTHTWSLPRDLIPTNAEGSTTAAAWLLMQMHERVKRELHWFKFNWNLTHDSTHPPPPVMHTCQWTANAGGIRKDAAGKLFLVTETQFTVTLYIFWKKQK